MESNDKLELAWEFINYTNRNVFLTGKAGTGKTSFLKKLKEEKLKNMVVVAPTGVAAINAKGVTIHSFFQLPFGPILPEARLIDFKNPARRFSNNKIKIIKSLDLLVIDEVSMVRADVLDGIDKILRSFRNKNKVFGGLQVLLIGDLFQLPPVVKKNEWDLLKDFYSSEFFYSSFSFQESNPIKIELNKVYRQSDQEFITILNEIRNNIISEKSLDKLNERYYKKLGITDYENFIYLTTHNSKAQKINSEKLDLIDSKTFKYEAEIKGNFPESSFPNREVLEFKEGAQVMFIKNDSSEEKRYYNGKIGKIVSLSKSKIVVKCPEDNFTIDVFSEDWDNIKYSIDAETLELKEDKLGTYSQIPLRLAWSITIHKSQGLTFSKAVIDIQDSFAHGQTYVALSRCESLEGLILSNEVRSKQIIIDNNIISFYKDIELSKTEEESLITSKKEFQLDIIFEIFNFYTILYPANKLLEISYQNKSIIGNIYERLIKIKDETTRLLQINNSLKEQLFKIPLNKELPFKSSLIQERFKKALDYFKKEFESGILENFNSITYSTDNKEFDKKIKKNLSKIEEVINSKIEYFNNINDKINAKDFLEIKRSLLLGPDKKIKHRTTTSKKKGLRLKKVGEHKMIENNELFEELRELRLKISNENNILPFQIYHQTTLIEICKKLPTTKAQLLRINGIGKVKAEKYGDSILNIIKEYLTRKNDS